MIRLGVDTGGTFTDLVRLDERGLKVHKVRSTPDDPARAILAGMVELLGDEAADEVVHGSTVATNAVLERKGARVALVTTAGFEDVLAIGRQTRRELYNFMVQANRPMVEPGMTFGVAERLDAQGAVVEALRVEELDALVEKLRAADAECVAVCLLHSYANAVHEQMVEEHLKRAGFVVSASHCVLPEYREYERWSTTVVNAYVTPMMSRYLTALEDGLDKTRLHVMQSNGGSISAGEARRTAVRTILSGPAAGVVGAQAMARASGFERVILFDMGGTSTDVSLVDGELGTTNESTVGDFPVRLPVLDIHTVGAGGGSIAYVDRGGALRVGPRSAGADPGPVCYGKGEELTVTDANLLLGRLEAEHFLGGRMRLDTARAMEVAETFAARLGISVTRLAEGIVQVANANMERAIRAVSVQRGRDPRGFALVAFGGAGGMHACEIAEAMEIGTVLVPRHAGVLSALGMLLADVRKDYTQTVLKAAEGLAFEELEGAVAPLVKRAWEDMRREGFGDGDVVVECGLDMRYRGQAYEIRVPLARGYVADFHREHQRLYGHANVQRATEVVNVRVNVAGVTKKHEFPAAEVLSRPMVAATSVREAWFEGGWWATSVYHREQLLPGMEGDGPAIVSGGEATVVVPPGFGFRVDGVGTMVIDRKR
jgi:N-methylhydantoinase A/oxoprolinase/acetone carboxylase beta subunit